MSGRKRSYSKVSSQPYKTSKKARPAKRSYQPKMVAGLANKNVLLPYGDSAVTTTNSQTVYQKLYRLNGLYDPLYALGGNQPLGFDQYAALYKKYYVKGVKVDCDFYAFTEAGVMPNDMKCFVWIDTDIVAPVSIVQMMERCTAKGGKFVRPGNVYAGGGKAHQLTLRATTKGVTDHGFEDPDLSSDVSTTPVKEYFLHVCWFGQSPAVPASRSVICDVNIVYDVIFYDAQNLPSS